MKTITIPSDVALSTLNGHALIDETGNQIFLKFTRFVLERLIDPKFCAGITPMEAAEMSLSIKQTVLEWGEAGTEAKLEDAHWKQLREATREPSQGYNMNIAHCMVPFMKAIVEAK